MRNRAYNYSTHICHDVLPTPMVAVLIHVVCLLGNGGYNAKDRTDDGEGKASTKVLYLVLARVRVVTVAHATST